SPDANLEAELELIDLSRKLAQAYRATGAHDAALNLLQGMAQRIQKADRSTQPAAKPSAGAAPAALPAKLIISAPKKLLDQVGAGKWSFENFREAATVEHLDFTPADKKPAKP